MHCYVSYRGKVNITGQCVADAFDGMMPDFLTHTALPSPKQCYTRSVTAELAVKST